MESVFKAVGKYITRRQNTVAQYIVTRPILDLCEQSARRPVARVSRKWWEQEHLNLEGEKKRGAVAPAKSDGEETVG